MSEKAKRFEDLEYKAKLEELSNLACMNVVRFQIELGFKSKRNTTADHATVRLSRSVLLANYAPRATSSCP